MDFFIEDNEECFCGSKKTFKLCCKKNIRDKEISFKEEILQFTNNPDRLSYIIWEKIESCKTEKCNYPGCDKKAINSHALQRNRILSRLTNDNHVLVFDPKEFNKSLGYLIAKLKGEEINHQCKFDFLNEVSIKKATTFEGFCNKHDTELFLPIEKYNYDRKDRKQNFLFAYRIVNQEYCDKQMLLNLFQNIFRERPILSTDFIFVENYRMRMLEVQDIEKLKRIFDNALIQNNYDLIKTHTIELKEEYKFAIATSYIPRKDIFGRQEIIDIYSKEEKRLPNIFLTIFPEENKTNIIFNWLKVDKKKLRILTNQLRTEDEKNIKKYLNNIIPRYSEKYVFSKKMWAKYNDDEKESFKRNFLSLDFKIFGLEYKDFLEESKFDFFKYK